MRSRLLDMVHYFWLPEGTIGEYFKDAEGFNRFKPEMPCEGYGLPREGAYIGTARIESASASREEP